MKQAVILAAGRGSRMSRLTQSTPKTLTMLAGKSLFDWQTAALKRAGITSIFVVVGYLSDAIKSKGYQCFSNSHWEETNMVESLCCAQEVLGQRVTVITYGDIVFSDEIVDTLLTSSHDVTMTYDLLWQKLWEERFGDPLKDAETFRIHNETVVEIGKKPLHLQDIQGQYMGLLKLTPRGWTNIAKILHAIPNQNRKKMEMTTLLQHLIDAEVPVHGVPIAGRWCEVDTPEDVFCYEQKLQEKENWTHDWRC